MKVDKTHRLGEQAEDWIQRAAGGIRFDLDRLDAERELREHIEDRAEVLARVRGLAPEEAETEALKRMGDADEIGLELAAAHRPQWGFLWRLSQILLGLEMVIILVLILGVLMLSLSDREVQGMAFGDRDGNSQSSVLTEKLSPSKEKPEVDGWTISMERAEWQENGTLHMDLKSFCWKPWLKEARFTQRLTAVDSLGRTYPPFTGIWTEETAKAVVYGYVKSGNRGILTSLPHLFTQNYAVDIWGVPKDAEWIRLEYAFMGRSFEMTLDLRGGESR